MIVETKNGPVTLPDNPPGGGYYLTADSMQPIPITTEQLWRLAPPVVSGDSSPSPSPLPKPVPTPPSKTVPSLTGWNLLFMTALSAGLGAFLATVIALRVSGGGLPSPSPPGPPGPSPSPPGPPLPPAHSPLGASLKTYLSTTPGEWQRIGSKVESGDLKTQKEILGAIATVSKPVWDEITPLVGNQTTSGKYVDSKGNVTDARSLGQAISAAGKEAAK